MVRTSPTPQDSPRPPTVTMVRCLRRIDEMPRGRMIERALPYGWEIVAGSKAAHPRTFFAWFPRWVGDTLIADGLVDSEGQITVAGMRHVHQLWKAT